LKAPVVRTIAYSTLALALAGALYFTPKLYHRERTPPAVLVTHVDTPTWVLRHDTLGRGETIRALLRRSGFTDTAATRALLAASTLNHRSIPAGMPITIRSESTDSIPTEVTLQLSTDRLLHLRRSGDSWTEEEEQPAWTTDTIVVSGTIESNLYAAMDASAEAELPTSARQQLAWSLADVYEYRVDMSRDLQVGDEFSVAAERSVATTGAMRVGKVIAATFKLSGNIIDAFRFESSVVRGNYFDQNGKSMRAAFLRAPLEFRRISSIFGSRRHPILGDVRQHKGTDYAADAGTPVRAIADGVVTRRGWGGGYGNVLEIRHRNGYVTRYGHLRGFASGIRVGSSVSIGKTVAYVGTTGLSTGPHLHFEVLVNGKQRDPRLALKATVGDRIPEEERSAFEALRHRLLESMSTH
jgi:murein DD-endopeptidase MepM/ murein hydrolase activator NlpD